MTPASMVTMAEAGGFTAKERDAETGPGFLGGEPYDGVSWRIWRKST